MQRKAVDKECDDETGLGDFGVRKYDFLVGRFTSIDPMWEKYYGMTPYQYSLNNPVKWIDNNGLLPGDPFLTRNDAAHDFGKNYNPFSIYLNLEISTTIYKYADDKGNLVQSIQAC